MNYTPRRNVKRLSTYLHLLFVCFWIPLLCTEVQGQTAMADNTQIPNKRINAFQEDSRGYIWIATGRGLCRFNGITYHSYFCEPDHENSLPSDFVNNLFLDRRHQLWASTSSGLCRYDEGSDSFIRYPISGKNKNTTVLGLIEAENGQLYAYGAEGVMVVDRKKQELQPTNLVKGKIVKAITADALGQLYVGCNNTSYIYKVSHDLKRTDSLSLGQSTDVNCLILTDQRLLIIGTEDGISAVDIHSGKMMPAAPDAIYPRLHSPVTDLLVRGHHLLICTENNGVMDYDWTTNNFYQDRSRQFLNNPNLHATCCFSDSRKNIWLGTFNQGYFVDTKTESNPDYMFNEYIQGKFATRICPDASDNLWFGTRYDGLYYYNVHTHILQHYNHLNLPILQTVGSDFVESMLLDSHQNLWVGIGKHVMKIPTSDGRLGTPTSFNIDAEIVTIAEDGDGTIWTGSSTDGIRLFYPNGNIKQLTIPYRQWINVTYILPMRSGQMLYSSYDEGLFLCNPKTLEISSFTTDQTLRNHISRAIYLYESPTGKLWIGTYGYGVVCYDMKSKDYEVFTMKDGLPSNDVLGIITDNDGNVWMSTSFGIAKYNPDSKKFLTLYETDGPEGLQFHEKAVARQRNGVILFGGNHGVSYFNPQKVKDPSANLHIVLENLIVQNQYQTTSGKILKQPLNDTEYIELSHKQNAFSLDFAAIEFSQTRHINYSCKLEGVDKDWNDLGTHSRLIYTNLSAGTYRLSIRARIGNGEWSPHVRQLTIHVRVSPWLRWPALLFYALLLGIVAYVILTFYRRSHTAQQRIRIMKEQQEREHELNETKIRFFTNISHELRTPLSMIYGPVKMLSKRMKGPENQYLTRIIRNNVERLLSLIDQLLDLAKMETDALKLQVGQTDAGNLLRSLVENYSFYAQEKDIALTVSAPPAGQTLTTDADKLYKVTSNLLSNALKYTPNGGHVSVEATLAEAMSDSRFGLSLQGKKCLVVSVDDDGVGVPPEKLPQLFQRFQRFEGKEGRINISGTGIGLNYTKRLVELHHGEIVAISKEKGMQFAFAWPADDADYNETEHTPGGLEAEVSKASTTTDIAAGIMPTTPDTPESDKHILVVEDNAELTQFIRLLLSPIYKVDTADDGQKGLEKARELVPDLIVSDVKMPVMDGFEMCRHIKSDASLCHIPVVMLTTRTHAKDQIEGYSHGADAYLNKPFDPDLLQALVKSIFDNIERRSGRYTPSTVTQNAAEEQQSEAPAIEKPSNEEDILTMSPLDQQFMKKFTDYIESHLDDSNLNMNQMASDLCLGRTVFYKKVKTLTGQTPNDFLQNYRLYRAAQLLDSRLYNVSQVCFMVGFSTPSHFSTSFKRQHGVSPREYLASLK